MDSEKEDTIGKWSASMKTGRKAILVIRGVIPTDGNKQYTLTTSDQQPTDPSTLVLEINPEVSVLGGTDEVEVYYAEILDRYDQYKSVLVRGNGKELALFGIE